MDYRIYDDRYDEVIRPLDLVDIEELTELSKRFHDLCPVEDFEPLRERLAAMKTPDVLTAVTLLIDNSGSMRGSKITFSIGTAGIISMYLDRLGIPNEILGFTTTRWKGGEPYKEFCQERKNAAELGEKVNPPGRLNSLRHVVYKQFDEKLDDVRHNLALMFKEGLLKENIDGEAVLWAVERLRAYPAENRILLVISDGAPVEDATQSCNYDLEPDDVYSRTSLLTDHLSHVVEQLKEEGDIKLDAIGMRHDVSRYYGVGDKVEKLEDLAPTAIRKLESLLQ